MNGQVLGAPAADASVQRWYGAASAHVVRFLHQLRRIPAATWLRVAAKTPLEDDGHADRLASPVLDEQVDYAARRRLRAVLEPMPAVVRRIRARVNNDLAVFEGILPDVAAQRMRRAANLAAFALAAQPELSPDDFRRLYRPFIDLIPPPPIPSASQELLGD